MDTEEKIEFVICVANRGYDDLEVWKLYRVLPDPKASEVGCLRVIDESGEDYLYPEDRFVTVDFPWNVRARLLAVPAKCPA
jgi:hypothetical protein